MTRSNPRLFTGMTAFMIVWLGQVVSLIGTAMTRFAVIFWAYQETGQATSLALVALFSFAPAVLLSPIAGALVDRWNRKVVMVLSDAAAGAATLSLLVLHLTGHLELRYVYAAAALAGALESFQFPAYSAAISTVVPPKHFGRANGLVALAESGSAILAPPTAAALLTTLGLTGIFVIDVVTAVVAIAALLAVHIPQPERTEAGAQAAGSLLAEAAFGFRYIGQRPSLLGLQLILCAVNLVGNFAQTLQPAMILARTGSNQVTLAAVQSAAGLGGVAGSLLMTAWGGPARRVHGLLAGIALEGLLSVVPMGLGRGPGVWAAAAFAGAMCMPVVNGSNQAIWQAKVHPDVQGRVFAARRVIAHAMAPVAMALAGPLADRVMEPSMAPGGSLAGVLGPLFGTGPGAGMAVLIVVSGILTALVGLGGYLFTAVRRAEDLLPDVVQVAGARPRSPL